MGCGATVDNRPRVHGVMMVKDMWPLCALSISFALERHVDQLTVIDHGSDDATAHGLVWLAKQFNGRLSVLRLDGLPYWQAEITTEVLLRLDAAPADWLYVLDADEFLLTDSDAGLRDLIGRVPSGSTSIRYPLDNWVSLSDFDETNLAAYGQLISRSVPSTFTNDFEFFASEIIAGAMNYFDIPFATKVIFRRRAFREIHAGSHWFTPAEGVAEVRHEVPNLRAAHLPLLNYAGLEGRISRRTSTPVKRLPDQDWQRQIYSGIGDTGDLDSFWRRHSVHDGQTSDRGEPTIVHDDRLSVELRDTIEMLRHRIGDRFPSDVGHLGDEVAPRVPDAWITSILERRAVSEELIDARTAKSSARQAQRDAQWDAWEGSLPGIEDLLAGFTLDWPRQSVSQAGANRIWRAVGRYVVHPFRRWPHS